MSDYVSRQYLLNEYDRQHQGPPGGARKIIAEAPAEDVAPVVRCGQCRYCTNNYHSSIYDECGRTGAYVSEDDYCSKGEKDDT